MITINGEQHSLDHSVQLQMLIQKVCGSNLEGIAAAVNGAFVPRSSWSKTTVQAGDDVEIVQATSGG